MRAGAESSRTTASVGSLGEQTLFAQRSPYGHPKSEIGSQVCLAAAISVCRPAVHRAKRGASARPQFSRRMWIGRPGLRRLRGRGGSLSLIPGSSARRGRAVRAEIGACHCAIANRGHCGDRGRCQRERSQTMPAQAALRHFRRCPWVGGAPWLKSGCRRLGRRRVRLWPGLACPNRCRDSRFDRRIDLENLIQPGDAEQLQHPLPASDDRKLPSGFLRSIARGD